MRFPRILDNIVKALSPVQCPVKILYQDTQNVNFHPLLLSDNTVKLIIPRHVN